MEKRRQWTQALRRCSGIQVIAPAAETGNVFRTRSRRRLAKKSLHRGPIVEVDGANRQRRRYAGYEGTKFGESELQISSSIPWPRSSAVRTRPGLGGTVSGNA